MCGFCGKAYFDLDRPVEREIISAMCQSITHRGPDDEGIYIDRSVGLGSRRLSIIDIESGHMPISNEDESIWITYNGEVYNFPQLRQKLEANHRFKTNSDTETIVHLYEEYGLDFVKQLNGMFAFALWDSRRKRLILVRDQVGIKPLYYSHLDDRIVFASEIKAILLDGIERNVDRLALHDYLSLNYVPGPRTMFDKINKLQPGYMLIADLPDKKVKVQQYWDFPTQGEENGRSFSQADLENDLTALLAEVVKDQMISDVPVGAFLSGGIDSSLTVALMSEVAEQPVKTFSIGFEEKSYNELPYARIVANHFKTDHEELLVRPKAYEMVMSIVDFFDEPFADNSALPVYAVSELAASQVKVVLSGDGGDEVFGGYYTYQADKLANFYRRLPKFVGNSLIPWVVDKIPNSYEKASFDFKLKRFVNSAMLEPLDAHVAWKVYLNEDLKQELYASNGHTNGFRSTFSLFREHYDSYTDADFLNRMLYVDSKVQLVDDMLTKVDRMSMAHSLEVRVPLLDLRVIDFMAQLPSSYKIKGFTLKHLLKQVASKILPKEIINRPKAGFTIPIAKWLGNELKDLVAEQLSPSHVKEHGFFDPKAINKLLEEQASGRQDYSRSIWTLLMFSLWCDRYLKLETAHAIQ